MTILTKQELKIRLDKIGSLLNIEKLKADFLVLKNQSEANDLWENQENAVKVMGDLSSVQEDIVQYDNIAELLEMAEESAEEDLALIDRDITRLEQKALLSGENDQASAILTIHAGTGGVDAMDWAEMLQRMYLRFVDQGKTESEEDRVLSVNRTKWQADIIEQNNGEEAGIKKCVIQIQGKYAYGLLKGEAGVHRLVRLSPFNAKNLRQTSFALVEVIPEIEQSSSVKINDDDLRIDVFRAGGHGGQGVNTTDSAVRITHIPTGIVVSVQNERSQHQNKATAMKILASKLVILQKLKNQEEIALLKGEVKEGSWGNQIRSYVLQPYQMVKDHRTNCETSNVNAVLDGDIRAFILEEASL